MTEEFFPGMVELLELPTKVSRSIVRHANAPSQTIQIHVGFSIDWRASLISEAGVLNHP